MFLDMVCINQRYSDGLTGEKSLEQKDWLGSPELKYKAGYSGQMSADKRIPGSLWVSQPDQHGQV